MAEPATATADDDAYVIRIPSLTSIWRRAQTGARSTYDSAAGLAQSAYDGTVAMAHYAYENTTVRQDLRYAFGQANQWWANIDANHIGIYRDRILNLTASDTYSNYSLIRDLRL